MSFMVREARLEGEFAAESRTKKATFVGIPPASTSALNFLVKDDDDQQVQDSEGAGFDLGVLNFVLRKTNVEEIKNHELRIQHFKRHPFYRNRRLQSELSCTDSPFVRFFTAIPRAIRRLFRRNNSDMQDE